MLFCNFVDTHAKATRKTLPNVVFHSIFPTHAKVQSNNTNIVMVRNGTSEFAHLFEKQTIFQLSAKALYKNNQLSSKSKNAKNHWFRESAQSCRCDHKKAVGAADQIGLKSSLTIVKKDI